MRTIRRVRALLLWIATLFRRARMERDLTAEIESHLDLHIDDNLRAGMMPTEACRQAVLALGGVEQTKERYRDRRGLPAVEALVQDLRFGARMLRTHRAFTAVAILTLALGIGATSAVFMLADPMLFRPLPYPQADRLVQLGSVSTSSALRGSLRFADYLRLRERPNPFDFVSEFTTAEVGTQEGIAYVVGPGMLEMLSPGPALGRRFAASEYLRSPAQADVVMISWDTWQTKYGGRPDILDLFAELGPPVRRYRIVGVLNRGFVLPQVLNQSPAFLLPGERDPRLASNRNVTAFPIARLRSDAPIEAATAAVQSVIDSVAREYPDFPQDRRARVLPLRDALFARIRTPLLLLLGATGCVLLLAAANLAHLFMARLHVRRREFGIRLAIGGGRWRLARQLVTEFLLLGAAGGVAALVVGQWTFDAIMATTPRLANVYRLLPAQLDLRVLAFAVLLVAAVVVVSGLLPVLAATRADVPAIFGPGGTSPASSRARRTQQLLVAVQAGVAVTLLITAALAVRSFAHLAFQPLGFKPQRLHLVQLPPVVPGEQLDLDAIATERRTIYEDLVNGRHIRAALGNGIPGQTLAGAIGRVEEDRKALRVTAYFGTGTYFDVLGVTLVRGETFDDREAFADAAVAVIDERAAARLWPSEDPVGKAAADYEGRVRTVIGVVRTVRTQLDADDAELDGTAYLPIAASNPARWRLVLPDAPSAAMAAAIRDSVQLMYPAASIDVIPMGIFERALGQPRFLAALLGTLGALTIALAIVGVFGVVTHQVAQRSGRWASGLRLAPRATRSDGWSWAIRSGPLPPEWPSECWCPGRGRARSNRCSTGYNRTIR